MKLETIYQIFQKLSTDDLSLIYQGEFNDDITEKIISLSEYNIAKKSELSKFKKKISFIMIECFQNIIRHAENPSMTYRPTNKSRIFLTRNIDNTYYIASANLIENKKIDFLKSKLNKINTLDKDELRELYLQILTTKELSDKGGAGVGLIEIARKSGRPLEFDFKKINDKFSFFYLQIMMQAKDLLNKETERKFIPIKISKEFHTNMISGNILMIYKGDFSHDSIMPILRMIEDNMANQLEELTVKKTVYLTLVEILQNISKHSLKHNGRQKGIFLMGLKKRKYIISAGNLIENNKLISLKSQLNNINSLNKTELNNLYKKLLREEKPAFRDGAGVGLIDIARKSSDKLEFNFTPVDENISFFSVLVKI